MPKRIGLLIFASTHRHKTKGRPFIGDGPFNVMLYLLTSIYRISDKTLSDSPLDNLLDRSFLYVPFCCPLQDSLDHRWRRLRRS